MNLLVVDSHLLVICSLYMFQKVLGPLNIIRNGATELIQWVEARHVAIVLFLALGTLSSLI